NQIISGVMTREIVKDVGKAQADKDRAIPALHMEAELLGVELGQRIGGLRHRLVSFQYRQAGRGLPRKGVPLHGLAGGINDSPDAELTGGLEDVEGAHRVVDVAVGAGEEIVIGPRIRAAVDHAFGAVEVCDHIPVMCQIDDPRRFEERIGRRHPIDLDDVVAALLELPDDLPAKVAKSAGYNNPRHRCPENSLSKANDSIYQRIENL